MGGWVASRGRHLRRLGASAAALVLLLSAVGCENKASSATTDAALRRTSDAGAEAGVRSASKEDAGGDDNVLPAVGGDDLQTRMHHLLEAIVQNNPDLANDAVFPREAYITVKDVPDPQKTWEKKVSGAFRRDVERLHKNLKGVAHAKFVSFELGHTITQTPPKKKDFNKPLWRVRHSKLIVSIEGKSHTIEISEMTAWRGAWYVTRLRNGR